MFEYPETLITMKMTLGFNEFFSSLKEGVFVVQLV